MNARQPRRKDQSPSGESAEKTIATELPAEDADGTRASRFNLMDVKERLWEISDYRMAKDYIDKVLLDFELHGKQEISWLFQGDPDLKLISSSYTIETARAQMLRPIPRLGSKRERDIRTKLRRKLDNVFGLDLGFPFEELIAVYRSFGKIESALVGETIQIEYKVVSSDYEGVSFENYLASPIETDLYIYRYATEKNERTGKRYFSIDKLARTMVGNLVRLRKEVELKGLSSGYSESGLRVDAWLSKWPRLKRQIRAFVSARILKEKDGRIHGMTKAAWGYLLNLDPTENRPVPGQPGNRWGFDDWKSVPAFFADENGQPVTTASAKQGKRGILPRGWDRVAHLLIRGRG